MRMIWADRIAFGFAVFIAASAAAVCVILMIAIGGLAADTRLFTEIGLWAGLTELVTALPLWLLLRGIDYLAGGPRLRARREARNGRVEPSFNTPREQSFRTG
jgi:hypothetical protein